MSILINEKLTFTKTTPGKVVYSGDTITGLYIPKALLPNTPPRVVFITVETEEKPLEPPIAD